MDFLTRNLPELVPHWIVSSDPNNFPVGYVVKRVGESRWIGSGAGFYCQLLTSSLKAELAAVDRFPLLSQRFLGANYEYRVFCFGSERATIRFPRPDPLEVPDLQFHPEKILQATTVGSDPFGDLWTEIGTLLGLTIFSADFMVEDEKPKLLEVNAVFGWAWLPTPCIEEVCRAFERFWVSAPTPGSRP